MFRKTWRWVGQFRRSNKNIGIHWPFIPEHLKLLCDDISYQLSHNTYELDEIAVRFHYRLVVIHPFANGNGRHARLITDEFLISLKKQHFLGASGRKRMYIEPLECGKNI